MFHARQSSLRRFASLQRNFGCGCFWTEPFRFFFRGANYNLQDMHRLCLCLANSVKLLGPTLLHQAAPTEGEVNRCFRRATPEQNAWKRWENIIKKKRPLVGTSNSCHNKRATEEFLERRIMHVKLQPFHAKHPSVIRSSPDGNNEKTIWRLQQPKWKHSLL